MHQTATADSLVGRRLEGRYRILDRIARGGMSTVYAAVDERLDRLVAVKVMNAALSADPAFSDRFAREARAAARLTHVNAVSVYDQGHEIAPDGHHVFLVMELVEGRTLRELIRERGTLNPAESLSIMEPVLSALSAAHRAGLVHRDVKPENILLSDEGVVKVADFGLARAVEADASSTRTGLMMGTVAYCAPEQLSRGNADPRSDVYSAGIVFFELLTGQPPYRGDSAMNVAWQHVHSRVPAPSSRVRGLPAEIDEIVVAVTDPDPASRPADAGAFLAELADVRETLALPVVGVPPRVRSRRDDGRQHDQLHQRGQSRGRRPEAAESATTGLRARYGRAAHGMAGYRTTGFGAAPNPHGDTVQGATNQGDTIQGDVLGGPGHGTPPGGERRRRVRDEDAPPPPVVIPPPRRRTSDPARRRRRGLIAAVLVLALGIGAFFGARAFIAWRFAHVPDVTKLTRSGALSSLHDAGYRVTVQPGPQFSETIPKGDVVRSDPTSGTRLATGHTVSITLSAGPHLYRIPSLRDKTPQEATNALSALGLTAVSRDYRQVHSRSVDKGLVISTSPAAGASVRRSQTIVLSVSSGPPMVQVPAIEQGTSVDDARSLVKAHHLHLVTHRRWSDTVGDGDVVGCQPEAGGQVVEDSDVTCVVSKGPHLTTVPRVAVGTSVGRADLLIRNAGLVPQNVAVPGGVPRSVLTVQNAGKTVHWGSTVRVYALPG